MRASSLFFASACCSGALLAAACGKESAATVRLNRSTIASASISSSSSSPGPPESATSTDTASATTRTTIRADADADADPYLTTRPSTAKSIGHTSYVLKLTFENGLGAVFKPRSNLPLGCCRYKGEIAAYRLARALGLTHVPRAIPHEFAASELRAAMTQQGADQFDRMAQVDPTGRVRGALMPWIERYEDVALERPAWRARWQAWLMDPDVHIEDADRPLARAISTMLAFDYITANWDRWSGGNVARDGASGTLLYVDNDGAFFETPPERSLSRQAAVLGRVLRFSRSFVAALRALDTMRLREAFGTDSRGEPLLSTRIVSGADARKRTVIGIVDAKVAQVGEAATMFFE
jgi:hypothetical protein